MGQRAAPGQPVSDGLPRLSVGALATDPSDGSIWVGTGEANNASENQYGVGVFRLARGSNTWHRVGGAELYGAGSYRIVWIRGLRLRRDQPRPVPALGARAAQPALAARAGARPGSSNYPPSSSVTDVHRRARAPTARKVLAVVGWAGYSGPPAVVQQRVLRRQRRARARFTRITPTGDINPATIGRTTFSASDGWLYAVVQDTTNDDLRGQGVFVSHSGNPAGPWTRIADMDKLAGSGSALGDSTQLATTRASRPTTTRTSSPTRRTGGTSTCSSRRSSSRPTAARRGTRSGPYWNYDISCDPDDERPRTPARRRPTPTSTPG